MAQPLSTADNTINLSSLKNAALERAPSQILKVRFWRRLSELIWAYTEESGEADTSSYQGLL